MSDPEYQKRDINTAGSKEVLREALREEVPGHTWSLLSFRDRPVVPIAEREGPYLIGDPSDAVYVGPDTFVIGDQVPAMAGGARLLCVNRDYEILWTVEDIFVQALHYSPALNRVIAWRRNVPVVSNEIREYNATTGALTNGPLIATTLGAIGAPTQHALEYDPGDPTKFWMAQTDHDVVVRSDWAGNVDMQYGVYDTPGDAANLLNGPRTVSVIIVNRWPWAATPVGRDVLIGDYGNNVVKRYTHAQPPVAFLSRLPWPYPYACFAGQRVALFSSAWGSSPFGCFTSAGLRTNPYMVTPMNTNFVRVHPTKTLTWLVAWDLNISEISVRDILHRQTPKAPPTSFQLWNAEPMSAGIAEESLPIPDWFRTQKTFNVKPSQDGTMAVEVARFVANLSYWDGGWEEIESIPIRADETYSHYLTRPLGICRLSVTLDVDGTVDGWVTLE